MSMSLDISALGPMLAVGVGAILLPIAEVLLARKRTFLSRPLTRERRGTFLAVGSLLCLVIALIVSFNGFVGPVRVFNMSNPMIVMDRVSHFLNIVVLLGAILRKNERDRHVGMKCDGHVEEPSLCLDLSHVRVSFISW